METKTWGAQKGAQLKNTPTPIRSACSVPAPAWFGPKRGCTAFPVPFPASRPGPKAAPFTPAARNALPAAAVRPRRSLCWKRALPAAAGLFLRSFPGRLCPPNPSARGLRPLDPQFSYNDAKHPYKLRTDAEARRNFAVETLHVLFHNPGGFRAKKDFSALLANMAINSRNDSLLLHKAMGYVHNAPDNFVISACSTRSSLNDKITYGIFRSF